MASDVLGASPSCQIHDLLHGDQLKWNCFWHAHCFDFSSWSEIAVLSSTATIAIVQKCNLVWGCANVSGHTNSFREWKYEHKSWILTNFKTQATQGKCHVGTCSVRQRNCRNLGLFALHSSWLAPNPPSSFASIGEMLFFRRKYGCCQDEKKIKEELLKNYQETKCITYVL